MGFKLYWGWKSKPKTAGRPPIKKEIRDVIRRMAQENPSWGAPHILSELRLLGYEVAQATVATYMPKSRQPPSQTWLDVSRQTCARCGRHAVRWRSASWLSARGLIPGRHLFTPLGEASAQLRRPSVHARPLTLVARVMRCVEAGRWLRLASLFDCRRAGWDF